MSKYNANVRVGEWYYDLILQKDKVKQYTQKSQKNELLVQRARLVFLYMLKEIPLTFPILGLSYGAVIQIISPELPTKLTYKIEEKQGIALGADIHYSKIEKRVKFAPGDSVIGTGLRTPCVRNVWTLVPWDSSFNGKQIRFGDIFSIRLYASEEPLYLECLRNNSEGECGYICPKLSSKKSYLSRFTVVNSNPSLRFETEGALVNPNENVAIVLASSGECLGVESDTWFPTYFGMECEVSIHTHRPTPCSHEYDPRNIWQFLLNSG